MKKWYHCYHPIHNLEMKILRKKIILEKKIVVVQDS